MRLILALLAASIAWGQPTVSSTTPVVVEWPNTFMRFNDNTSFGFYFGDTNFTYIDQHGHRYFMGNDCWWNASSEFSNVCVSKMTTYDPVVANNNNWSLWSSAAFKTAYHLIETTSPNCGGGCSPRTRGPACMGPNGYCYFSLDMEAGDGNPVAATIIRTDNIDASPVLWKNPANLAGGGNSNGDMPTWTGDNAAAGVMFPTTLAPTGGGTIPNNSKYGHIYFILPGNFVTNGSDCPVIPTSMGGDGAGTYAYFYTANGLTLFGPHRVTCANLPHLLNSEWETWTGSAWSSNLTLTQTIADLCWCTGGLYGVWNPGTSPQITLLPDLGTIVLVGQVYKYTYTTLPTNAYNPALQASMATSILGPFVPVQSGQLPTDTFQTGTNPRTRKLSGNVSASTPGAADTITVDVPYLQGLEPQETAFLFTIGTETMRTNFANLAATIDATSWPVIRGINGTAPAHSTGDEVQAPIRNEMQLASFVPGSYTYANGRACMDLIANIGQSDGTTNDNTKANAVYGPGINIVCFQRAPQQKTTVRGNTPIRFQKGHMGKLAIDPTHIVGFMNFNEHNGNAYYGKLTLTNQINLLQPADLVGTMACTPSADAGGGDKVQWSAFGLLLDQGGGYLPHCTTVGNTPITGGAARTITIVFRTANLVSPMLYEQTSGAATTQLDAFVADFGGVHGAWWQCNDVACVTTPAGVVAANTWVAISTVYSGGNMDGSSGAGTGMAIFKNGAYVCGKPGPTACPSTGGASALNTSASPINIGGTTPYNSQAFSGEIASLIFHNAAVVGPDMAEFFAGLAAALARRGITF